MPVTPYTAPSDIVHPDTPAEIPMCAAQPFGVVAKRRRALDGSQWLQSNRGCLAEGRLADGCSWLFRFLAPHLPPKAWNNDQCAVAVSVLVYFSVKVADLVSGEAVALIALEDRRIVGTVDCIIQPAAAAAAAAANMPRQPQKQPDGLGGRGARPIQVGTCK